MPGSHNVRRGDGDNTIDIKRTYTLLIDLEEVDPAYEDDEVTLESDDKEYKQTLTLGKDGEMVDERWMKITFTKIKPGKTYTCIHDLKRTSSKKTGKIILFRSSPLETKHLNKPQPVDESLSDLETKEPIPGLIKEEQSEEMAKWTSLFGKQEKPGGEEKLVSPPEDGRDDDLWLDKKKEEQGWHPHEDEKGDQAEENLYQPK